ncbi:ABC transporter substrate-binding protein [Azospirillum sp. TSH100]|uniref:ABC transporter substrate-binding protein n=1 Tax=Azospirillum sp. TSH100 TaxID=652764 RepID=UPI000D68DF16|nr:ABC transporter substrate-binding protein [Azospirillum sp. TSH100]QCG89324.1 aliphatic sulfonate ABC transporter substrate-binding protein [Azospirillum sp. TSH100]
MTMFPKTLPSLSRRHALGLGVGALAASLLPPRSAQAAIPAGTILKVGDQKGGVQSVLEAAGLLADLPYRIEWSQFPAAAPLLEALNAGAIEVGYAGDAPTTFALAAGTAAKIIGAVRSNPQSTTILVPGTSPIRSVADLKGRTIGTGRGSIGHYLVLAALKANGLKPDDVKIAFLLPSDAKSALAAGSIDAWSTWGIYVSQSLLVDGARAVVTGSGLMSGLSYQSATLEAIATKRDALADLIGRTAAARLWALENSTAYADIWAKAVGVDPAIARHTFGVERARPVAIDGSVVADQQATSDVWREFGIIPKRLDAATIFDPGFNSALPA